MIILGVPNITNNEIVLFFSAIAIIVVLGFGIILSIFRLFNSIDLTYQEIVKIIAKFSIVGVLIVWTINFIYHVVHWYNYSPTSVTNRELKGLYEIDTLYFRGENANWQHSHYNLEIGDDSLKLIILNENRIIGEFQKKIINVEVQNRSFFTFHDDYSADYFIKHKTKERYYHSKEDSLVQTARDFKLVNDSLNHHMLRINPSLLLNSHDFRVVIYSTKYKNMFFKKID